MMAFRGYISPMLKLDPTNLDQAKANAVNWIFSKAGCKGRLVTRLNYKMQVENKEEPIDTGELA